MNRNDFFKWMEGFLAGCDSSQLIPLKKKYQEALDEERKLAEAQWQMYSTMMKIQSEQMRKTNERLGYYDERGVESNKSTWFRKAKV